MGYASVAIRTVLCYAAQCRKREGKQAGVVIVVRYVVVVVVIGGTSRARLRSWKDKNDHDGSSNGGNDEKTDKSTRVMEELSSTHYFTL